MRGLWMYCLINFAASATLTASPPWTPRFAELAVQHCGECHAGPTAEASLDLAAWSQQPLAAHFADWRRVRLALSEETMPPKESASNFAEADRHYMLAELDQALRALLASHGDDPGPHLIRRLTSAEYDYCIEDLTGLKLGLGEQFVSDNVGGTGFTNSASGQFLQDATLERYIEAARRVSQHGMIGSGKLYFYEAPGATGLELSAARRIQDIYRRYGIRAAAGEGAEPYGLDRFARAFQVAWQFQHRQALGWSEHSLDELARRAHLEPRFADHMVAVLQRSPAPFPLSEIIARFQQFPTPEQLLSSGLTNHEQQQQRIAQLAQQLYAEVQSWQSRLAGSASAEEEVAVLAGGPLQIPDKAHFVARATRLRTSRSQEFTPDLNNASLYSEDGRVRFKLSVEAASHYASPVPVVIFANPQFRFRVAEVVQPDPVPVRPLLDLQTIAALRFGENQQGEAISADEFVIEAGQTQVLEFNLPEACRLGELIVDVRLDSQRGRDCVVRCVIEDVTSDGGRSFSSLLRDPHSQKLDEWQAGVAEFGRALPQISHREPNPSDRDPIPFPYDNTYNLPERNFFHTAVKYHRDDAFLVEHLLPDEARRELDLAWTDLLTSFDYHDVNVRFVCRKYGIALAPELPLEPGAAWLGKIADEPRRIIEGYLADKQKLLEVRAAAEQQQLGDMLSFARQAWRRPLTASETAALREFYVQLRDQQQLSHSSSLRACLTRILVSPDFLFRVEQPGSKPIKRLNDFELASRLSFFLWSSIPDQTLNQLAEQGLLSSAEVLEAQVRRLLSADKSRRLATEFFGQWLGFYQFDRFSGVDPERFPEFDAELKAALYEEAIAMCQHIVQADLPYHAIVDAETTFVDRRAAEHYGIAWQEDWIAPRQFNELKSLGRGGVCGLAAVLTSTSAPLRTSPVKRGDWILRRLLGTPVPPPPADAGSLPAEEVLGDGKTVRQRLEAHRQQTACLGCHQRIDPLGFTLEHFDSLGRWRQRYADGQTIDDAGELPTGQTLSGLSDLQQYLRDADELVRRNMATKLVAYALGRTETLADAALIERIMQEWQADPRFSTAVLAIVRSPQFHSIQGPPSQPQSQ